MTLIEVCIAVLVFLFGVVALLNFYPLKISTGASTMQLTEAVLLAQAKAEEVRRDNAGSSFFFVWLRSLDAPQPDAGIAFAQSADLRYAFSGRSVVDPVDDADVPEDDFNVPRIIVFTGDSASEAREVVYELRFEN